MISVIIPYYQGSRYLPQLYGMMERNARTLYRETGTELEVLLVNDSPWEKLAAWNQVSSGGEQGNNQNSEHETAGCAEYRLIILTNPKNRGIHATRVNGLMAAEGEYILFLDQDDRITDDCLLSQLNKIGDADLVIGNGYEGESGGGRHLIFSDSAVQAAAADLNCHYYYNNLIRSPGQVLLRKSSIPSYWTEQILKYNGSDDAFLWILMFCQGCRAALNEEAVYEHVFTGENSSGNSEMMLRSQQEVASKLKGIASEIGMRSFRRRAEYYCTSGVLHRLRYLDVGISRAVYSRLYMNKRERKDPV